MGGGSRACTEQPMLSYVMYDAFLSYAMRYYDLQQFAISRCIMPQSPLQAKMASTRRPGATVRRVEQP